MGKKKRSIDDLKTYALQIRATCLTEVVVTARNEDEARQKADSMDWLECNLSGSEIVDYKLTSAPKLC